MADTTEEQTSEMPDFQRYLDIARRRYLQFLLPLLAGWLMVWGLSWVIHPKYKSSTLILVEEPTMLKNFVDPNAGDDLQDRLQSITQQILSRTRLMMVMDNLHLYQEKEGTTAQQQSSSATPDERVERMRKDITVELVRDTRNNQITAFRISYIARDPHVAQLVTQQLTDLFINGNLRVRQQESEGTTSFFQKQLDDARATLAEANAKVQAFESSHIGALPTQQAGNLEILSSLQSQLQNEQDALNTARQQRVYLQSVLQQSKEARLSSSGASFNSTELTAIDTNLAKLRADLADLSSRYTDRYPDVEKLREQIAKTEKMRSDLIASLKAKNEGSDAATDGSPNSPLTQFQSNLHANQLEISNREAAIASLKSRIDEYQGRLNEAPVTEQELATLTQAYDQAKTNYDDLLKKTNASTMATDVEQIQQGERFTMLDPPSLPVKPDSPNRLKFCGIGLVVGLLLGVLSAAGFEFLDHRLHSDKDIKAMLPAVVFSDIPDVLTPADLRVGKRKQWLNWAASGAVAAIILSGAVISYLHG